MRLTDFDYNLPNGLIAQYPAQKRDASRLLVLDKSRGHVSHRSFSEILDYLKQGDCLVLNDTKVIPARLWGVKENSKAQIEVLLLEKLDKNMYKTLIRPGSKLKPGNRIVFGGGRLVGELLSKNHDGAQIRFASNGDLPAIIEEIGEVPLPPYIQRKPEGIDKTRYQTVFAQKNGAVAAPTAGLHFTQGLLDAIRKKGVEVFNITLHVGYGTFKPVKADDIKDHDMDAEYFEISQETAAGLNKAKDQKRRIIAVGTTTTRALETAAQDGRSRPAQMKTGLFIYPGYKFKFIDGLLTNFHLPRTTLLMLVCAFAGQDFVLRAYEEAVAEKYRFYSYGDCMLII